MDVNGGLKMKLYICWRKMFKPLRLLHMEWTACPGQINIRRNFRRVLSKLEPADYY